MEQAHQEPCLNLCWVVIRMSSLGFWPPMIEACTAIPQGMVHQILITFHSTGHVVQPSMSAVHIGPMNPTPQSGSYPHPQMTMVPPPQSASFVAPQATPDQYLNIGPTHIPPMTLQTRAPYPPATAYHPPMAPDPPATHNPPGIRERPASINLPISDRREAPITPRQTTFYKAPATPNSPVARQFPASKIPSTSGRPLASHQPLIAPKTIPSPKAPVAPKPGISPTRPSAARTVWMAAGESGKLTAVECSTIVSLNNILVRYVRWLLAFN
jgi:hypothetical protein